MKINIKFFYDVNVYGLKILKKPLANFEIDYDADELKIKYNSENYMCDTPPQRIISKERGRVNLDSIKVLELTICVIIRKKMKTISPIVLTSIPRRNDEICRKTTLL